MSPMVYISGSAIERRSAHPFAVPPRGALLVGLLVAALLLTTGESHAIAIPEPQPADELMNLPLEELLNVEITAASRFSQKASDAPSAVSVVTAEDIRTYGYRTLADILESIRGLYVTNDRNYQYLGVRGFSRPGDYNSRVLLLVDGYRVTDNVYDQAPIGTDFPIDVDLIERVEFIPGPGSSIYGSGAFLGVINVLTRKGADFQPAEVKLELASADTWRARISAGKAFESGAQLLLSATQADSEGRNLYFPEYDTPTTNYGIATGLDYDRSGSFFGKFSSDGWTAELIHAERTKGIPTASYGQVFNDPRSQTEDRRSALSLGYVRAWSDHDFAARLAYTDWSYAGTYAYAAPPVGSSADGAKGQWIDAELQFGTRLSNHHVIAGADYHRDLHQDQFSYQENPPVTYLDDRRSGYRYGLYLEDEIGLGERFLVNAGLRYDDYYEDDLNTLNPRLAAIWKARETTTLKALYGTAFRAPNAYERYFLDSTYKPNPYLRPENIRTYELVLEERNPRGLRLSGSLFHYDIEDLISLTTDPNDGLLVFANVDRATTDGVEVEAERIWQTGMRLRGSVTWQHAHDASTGERLTNSPSVLGKLNFTMPVFRGWADAGVEGQYTGRRLTLDGQHAGSYTVVNLTLVTRRIASGLEVSASIYNLLDKDYGDPGSQEHLQDVIPQDGRSVRLSGTYRF